MRGAGLAAVFIILSLVTCSQQADSLYLKGITLSGNHKTKPHIIFREIVLQPGTAYSRDEYLTKLQRSRQNLMNTGLFNFVDTAHAYTGDTLELNLKFTERWYIWPSPVFEIADPNFNTWWEARDLSRTSLGGKITAYNMRGRKEVLRLTVKRGYTRQFSLAYEIPFIEKTRRFGLNIYTNYATNYQVTYTTRDNKRLFYTDLSGLARRDVSTGFQLQYRKRNYGRHYFTAKYNSVQVDDTLLKLAPDYLLGNGTGRKTLELTYQFDFDKRDYGRYPLSGSYYTVALSKPDIDLGPSSRNGIFMLYAQVKKYYPLGHNLFYAFSATAKQTWFRQLPYYMQRGLGYGDFVRGYEYYVIDAQQYLAFKSNFKIRMFKRQEVKIFFIRDKRFNRLFFEGFFNLNADAGYAGDRLYHAVNPLSNELLLGGGVGFDLISFYDVVMRSEYSWNKLGQHGFFLHFSKPI